MIDDDRLTTMKSQSSPVEPLRAKLSDVELHAPQSLDASAKRDRASDPHWRRWINTLWGLPTAAAALLCLIALAQSLRELSGVEAFIEHHPCIAQAAPSVEGSRGDYSCSTS